MNNIFLPNETIEVTPFLCKGQEDKWFLRVNEGLCANAMANGGYDDNVQVRSITFNCENASILVNVNQLNVNICHNELVSLYSGALLEDLNHNFGRKSMIKKSLLLIKSWCSYDSAQYSAAGKSLFPDLISAKVLHILVLHIFCRFGGLITHPLIALSLFLCYYSTLDWKSVLINIESSLSVVDLKPLTPQNHFLENSPIFGLENTNSDELQQITSLITNYRLRYQNTVWASTRAKEEDNMEPAVEGLPRDSLDRESDDRLSASYLPEPRTVPRGGPAWGIASACSSLTSEYQPPPGLPAENEIWDGQEGRKKGNFEGPQFNAAFMNVSDSIRPFVNLTASISGSDVAHITSILSSGYLRFATVLRRCRDVSQRQGEYVDLGMGTQMDLTNYFISEAMGMSRDVANVQKLSSYSPDDAANIDELKSSKYFCESEGPESVMRHAELIMGSKITADAVAHLIAHIVEQAGPHPIGEIGKLLQEATGNPNLSRVLKSQFRGLKKLIEGYPHMLRLGGDHSFNPHVYLSEKSCSHTSDAAVDALFDGMTDRESDEPPMSPPVSFTLQPKKQLPLSPSNGQVNGINVSSSDGYSFPSNGQTKGHANIPPQYPMPYRSEGANGKTKNTMNSTTPPPWQLQDRLFAPSPPGFSNQNRNAVGTSRLHADAGEFEPGRGTVEQYNGARQRTDHYAIEHRNSNLQVGGNPVSQSYTPYRTPQYDQNQYMYSSRSTTSLSSRQNPPLYQSTSRVEQPPRPTGGHINSSRYDSMSGNSTHNDMSMRNSITNRISYGNNTNYPPIGQSWERIGVGQYESESTNANTSGQTTRMSHGNIGETRSNFGLGYDMDFGRSSRTSLGQGRLPSEIDIGLEFESDRQSFLLPSDYDGGSQSYSISDYDILKDVAFANTVNPFGPDIEDINGHLHFGRRGDNRDTLSSGGTTTGSRLDSNESFNGDSKMLAYFLRDSER